LKDEIESHRLQLRSAVQVELVYVCSLEERFDCKCSACGRLEQAEVRLVPDADGLPSAKIFVEPRYGQ
jgi:hypothetical protein